MKKESFELGFEVRESREIPQAGRQRIPDSWGNETERTVANRSETELRDFQEFFEFRSMIGACVKSATSREKLKCRKGVYRRSDGRQELRSCIISGISQAANGVHSAAVLYGLAKKPKKKSKNKLTVSDES